MRKACLAMVMLLMLLLTGCTTHAPFPMATTDTPAESLPVPYADDSLTDPADVTLWFRFGEEPLLAPERSTLHLSPTEPYEMTLLKALLRGPSTSQTELSGLFPTGTRCTATYRQGRRLFVTLSRQVLNAYPDETFLRTEEARMRRLLAMQSIAATVTENCDVDETIILVEQGEQLTDSLRLRESYYLTPGAGNTLAAPLTRNESLLLTHGTAMDVILRAWSERDWARLYRYVARRDPATGQTHPEGEALLSRLETLPHLVRWNVDGGSVSLDGQRAVFTLEATFLDGDREYTVQGQTIHLHRERGLWRITLSQLTDRVEVAP